MIAVLQWNVAPLQSAAGTDWETWDRLNDENFGGHPMLASTMIRALARHFGGDGLRLACGRVAGDSYAQAVVLPTGFGRWSLFCPAQTGVGALVFDRRIEGRTDLLSQFVSGLPGFAVELTLPYQDPLFAWAGSQHGPSLHHQHLGTTVAVDSPSGFDQYWSGRSKKLRDNLKRYIKRATEQRMEPRLEVTTDAMAIGAAVERYGELESRGWKGREGTAVHPTNAQGLFYNELMTAFAARGQAHISELYLGERLAASRLTASGPSMHVALKTTYDEELRAYAPGRIHRYLVTRDLLERTPVRPIEFYTKADHDALIWATRTRDLWNASVYRNALIGRLAHCRRTLSRSRRDAASSDSSDSSDAEGQPMTNGGHADKDG